MTPRPQDPLDAVLQEILDECINGVTCNHMPIFGNVRAIEVPIKTPSNFEYNGCTYNLYHAVLVSVLQNASFTNPQNAFKAGADLIICEIAHWSDPDTVDFITYVNRGSAQMLKLKEVKERLIKDKLSQQSVHYGARRFDGWCDADFPIHALLHLQRMLAIHPSTKMMANLKGVDSFT